jgi:hypothetical protein
MALQPLVLDRHVSTLSKAMNSCRASCVHLRPRARPYHMLQESSVVQHSKFDPLMTGLVQKHRFSAVQRLTPYIRSTPVKTKRPGTEVCLGGGARVSAHVFVVGLTRSRRKPSRFH